MDKTETIVENENYKIYEEGNYTMFEILNEEVSCSHGATIGPIDEESIFYLNARGINKNNAVRMIVSGFVSGTLRQVPSDLKERITGFVTQRLEHL